MSFHLKPKSVWRQAQGYEFTQTCLNASCPIQDKYVHLLISCFFSSSSFHRGVACWAVPCKGGSLHSNPLFLHAVTSAPVPGWGLSPNFRMVRLVSAPQGCHVGHCSHLVPCFLFCFVLFSVSRVLFLSTELCCAFEWMFALCYPTYTGPLVAGRFLRFSSAPYCQKWKVWRNKNQGLLWFLEIWKIAHFTDYKSILKKTKGHQPCGGTL